MGVRTWVVQCRKWPLCQLHSKSSINYAKLCRLLKNNFICQLYKTPQSISFFFYHDPLVFAFEKIFEYWKYCIIHLRTRGPVKRFNPVMRLNCSTFPELMMPNNLFPKSAKYFGSLTNAQSCKTDFSRICLTSLITLAPLALYLLMLHF